jgi:hypothetical protein
VKSKRFGPISLDFAGCEGYPATGSRIIGAQRFGGALFFVLEGRVNRLKMKDFPV